MTTIEKDKNTLTEMKDLYSKGVITGTNAKWLIDTLEIYILRYERLQKAASESVGNAHITNTRLKRVMVDDNN